MAKKEMEGVPTVVNKYHHIQYLKTSLLGMFNPNELVWIEEKIDGANTSIEINENSEIHIYGRRYELDAQRSGREAYDWLLPLAEKIKDIYESKYIFYFEFLTQHHVKYDKSAYNKGYLISVMDSYTKKYINEDEVYKLADELGVEHAPLFYKGGWQGWDHVNSLLGKSELGAEVGEGVIIKAEDPSEKGEGQKFLKVVTEDFKEKMKFDDTKRQIEIQGRRDKLNKAAEIVTPARIRKQLYKLIDEGVITNPDLESWSDADKKLAIKYIGKLLYADCVSEESEFVESFGKEFGSFSFIIAKDFINSL